VAGPEAHRLSSSRVSDRNLIGVIGAKEAFAALCLQTMEAPMAQAYLARKRVTRLAPTADPNVIPFIDVLLVLLIIFMVTAPKPTTDLRVDLPQRNVVSPALLEPTIVALRQTSEGRGSSSELSRAGSAGCPSKRWRMCWGQIPRCLRRMSTLRRAFSCKRIWTWRTGSSLRSSTNSKADILNACPLSRPTPTM